MSIDVYTGKDLVTLNDNVVNDLAQGDVVEVSYPDNVANLEVGKNGNSIVVLQESGGRVEVTIRVLFGNTTDMYFNGQLKSFQEDPASYVGFSMKLTKKIGDGQGKILKCIWSLEKGVVSKIVGTKTNTTGDVEQGVAIYNLLFTKGERTIR